MGAGIPSAAGLIEEVLAAEVVGFVEGSPGHLVLGRVISLGGGEAPDRSFQPADEGLDGFQDDDASDEDFGTASA